VIVTRFTAVRRRVERELLRSRDGLQKELVQRRMREEQIRELNEQLEKRSAALKANNKELGIFWALLNEPPPGSIKRA
jgi:hypothetical protein